MEPGNFKSSVSMENFILKAGHYSAGPSLVGQTPSQTYSNMELLSQNYLMYLQSALHALLL